MSASFNWHNLPVDMRLGSTPEDPVVLYRGFAGHQFDPETGMLSSALAHDHLEILVDVIDAVEKKDIGRLIGHISTHADNLDGVVTPFISATPEKEIAERYARGKGERVATITVLANQITIVPMLPYEVLILGSIDPSEITNVEEAPDMPRFSVPYPFPLV